MTLVFRAIGRLFGTRKGQSDKPGLGDYRRISLDWVAASTVDDDSTIVDGAPQAGAPILFDAEEARMIEGSLGFMVDDLYYKDEVASAIERSLAASGLEASAKGRAKRGDFRRARSACIKAISIASLPSSWLILGDICEAEGMDEQASAARAMADEAALNQGTNPEAWHETHDLTRKSEQAWEELSDSTDLVTD
jgi:hypothetical protein